MNEVAADRDAFERRYDVTLIFVVVVVLGLGLVMVASASTSIAAREHADPLALFWSQSVHVAVALGALGLCARTPVRMWERAGPLLMLASVALLALVLLPGVGREANGATPLACGRGRQPAAVRGREAVPRRLRGGLPGPGLPPADGRARNGIVHVEP